MSVPLISNVCYYDSVICYLPFLIVLNHTKKDMKVHSAVLEYPFMMYTFVEDRQKHCQVDFLVYTMVMSNYRVSMNAKGDFLLSLNTSIPQFFYGSERMDKAN